MDTIHIRGNRRLNGVIPISGAKNAALPLMIAALLTDETLKLTNVPRLTDVRTLAKLLGVLGTDVQRGETAHGDTLALTTPEIVSTLAPYEIVSQIRATFWVLGPLLARCRTAKVSLPGGCAIGARPVDLYLKGLQKMGAEIDLVEGYVLAKAPNGLKGAVIRSPIVSVGATHTLLMAATLADGETVLENAAREPEITDLARCLVAMGAKIEGIGTSTLRIEGVERLHGATHNVVADRIEAGTYAIAAAMTGGEVTLDGVDAETFDAALSVLRAAGAGVDASQGQVRIFRNGERLQATDVVTQVFPGFPTDLQAQFMALMTTAEGESEITETIFENRFMHVQELARFGANISLHGDKALVHGVDKLTAAPVMASDLRASAALVIAALAAEGETTINRVYHLDRGFDRMEEKLSACGAEIWRAKA
ncbi:MAG: UDP-N-acetylglucosamine 1-carboxyvinyltransferase [Parvibaculum sp.]|uniref:UDP-N-acetylglucosamine 1-carboxyvinyltransferase n=1 Tax=Parvibaculum sp. TaxID=2024848 RepID=UPI0025E84C0A|nr:UDP-N-acetylglucosamine 1-carboxyvinyltransferase [Parvibaculum sp.]MCE9649782.1 UDP-N-acetylglucosamine 1-carboxyvinyltransferase [Parvibaculum sp.]